MNNPNFGKLYKLQFWFSP